MNMNTNQKKQQQLNRGIAIAVAILLALTLIVTLIAFSASKRSVGTSTDPTTKKPSQTTNLSNTDATTVPGTDGTTGNINTPDDKPTDAKVPEFVCPVAGALIKDYSADIPVFSTTMEDYRVHCGIDIGADAGTAVMAAADGEISKVYYDPMMGQTVEITHVGGYTTIYKNLQTKLPSGTLEGVKVSAGDTIGYVGDTALVEISESPHLHFEIIKDEEYTNPLSNITVSEKDASEDYED